MSSINQITLIKRTSVFEGMIIREKFDRAKMIKFINSDLMRLTMISDPKCSVTNGFEEYMIRVYNNEKNLFIKYVENLDSDDFLNVKMQRGTYAWGRVNARKGLSLANMERKKRHTIAGKYFVDVDMDNCQPKILKQVCDAAKIDCPCLSYYVDNRADVLSEIIHTYSVDRESAKNYFIQKLFGGNFSRWELKWGPKFKKHADEKWIPTTFISNFESESNLIAQEIANCNPEIVKFVVEQNTLKQEKYDIEVQRFQDGLIEKLPKKPTKNVFGKVLSVFCQDKENDCIEAAYLEGLRQGKFPENVFVHCADGFMQPISTHTSEDCQMYSDAVFKATGFQMSFSVKEMDLAYDMKTLNDHIQFDFIYEKGWSTSAVAEYFKYLYCHERVSVKDVMYNYNGFIWESDDSKNSNTIMFIDEVFQPRLAYKFNQKIKELETKLDASWEEHKSTKEQPVDENEFSAEDIKKASDIMMGKMQLDNDCEDVFESAAIQAKKLKHATKVMKAAEKQKKEAEKKKKKLGKEEEKEKAEFCKTLSEYELLEKVQKAAKQLPQLNDNKLRIGYFKDIYMKLANDNIKFDKNIHVFAFNNRLVDLITGNDIEPNPDLYILTTCGYNYHKCYDTELIQKVMTIYEQILPNKEVCEYYKTILATGMGGFNVPNLITCQGVGRNGKSVVNGIFKKTIGKYGYRLASGLYTEKFKDTTANPQAANLHKIRGSLTSELEGNIYASVVKMLTSGADISARNLFSKDCEVSINATFIIESNASPVIVGDSDREAIMGRIRAIEFVSRFLSDEAYDKETDHESKNIYRVVTEYGTDLFHEKVRCVNFDILLPYYKIFVQNKFALPRQPELCRKFTSQYHENNDRFYQWFQETYKRDDTPTTIFPVKNLFELFKRSDQYKELPKDKKQAMTMKTFLQDNVYTSPYLKQYVKNRKEYYNGQRLTCDNIFGWKLIEDEGSDYQNMPIQQNVFETIITPPSVPLEFVKPSDFDKSKNVHVEPIEFFKIEKKEQKIEIVQPVVVVEEKEIEEINEVIETSPIVVVEEKIERRGRPKKIVVESDEPVKEKKPRGRPKKE